MQRQPQGARILITYANSIFRVNARPLFAPKEIDMRIFVYVLIAVIAALMLLCYSLCAIASEADERAERMYRKWKESKDGRFDKTE